MPAKVGATVEAPNGETTLDVSLPLSPESIDWLLLLVTRQAQLAWVTVTAATDQWTMSERFCSVSEASSRLFQLRSIPLGVTTFPFSAVPTAVDAEPDSDMAKTFAVLDRSHFRLTGDCLLGLQELGYWQRAFVLSVDPKEEMLRYIYIGSGLAGRLGLPNITQAIGRPADHGFGAKDDKYFTKSSMQYETVVARKEHLRHYVDSLVPTDGATLPVRLNYDRIMVRVELESGRPALLITTQARPKLLPLAPTWPRYRQEAAIGPSTSGSATDRRRTSTRSR